MNELTPPRVAILISGRGSNMLAILDRAREQRWRAHFVRVISNRPKAAGLALAAARGIPTLAIDHRPYGKARRADFDRAVRDQLLADRVDWVVLAGFMRILGPDFTDQFAGRTLNIHPSLLPKYPGLNTHARAIEAGDDEAGCTVHLIDETLDGGRILGQARVPVLEGDDPARLAARVLLQEHKLYPRILRAALEGRLEASP